MLTPAIALAFLAATIASASAETNYEAAKRLVDEGRAERAAEQKARCAKLGGVRIGLNAEGVRKSCWGNPKRINETVTGSHRYEQWVFSGGYVYLTDGVVTSYQRSQ
jgi:hypothetical protein